MEFVRPQDRDTICAISTPPGHGGIAVLRVSGPHALEVTRKVTSSLPESLESHKIYFSSFINFASKEIFDEGLISFFKEGHSYTGEETCELSCHGGQTISQNLLNQLIEAGARIADPGEFTYRAFLNGNLDLAQAESVLDLIESQTPQAAKIAVRNLQGDLSKKLNLIKVDIEWMLAHLEASIDFSTEDIEVVDHGEIYEKADHILAILNQLINSYSQGRIIKEGLHIGLVGQPNVGKSSLLNSLVGEERAIVTDEPGTTRDLIEASTMVGGVKVHFVDTAGLRETENKVERIGIDRTRQVIDRLDHLFLVVNANSIPTEDEFKITISNADFCSVIINKLDLTDEKKLFEDWRDQCPGYLSGSKVFGISVKTGHGLLEIENFIKSKAQLNLKDDGAVLTNARHYNSLVGLRDHLSRAITQMKENQSPEFVAFELQDCQRAIYDILGLQVDEQIIDRIFKEFCLGK